MHICELQWIWGNYNLTKLAQCCNLRLGLRLASVPQSSYGNTWEVMDALKKLELQGTIILLSITPA